MGWHKRTQDRVKAMAGDSLLYALKDLNKVLAIQDGASWADPLKVGQYHDERHYVVMEITKRRRGE